MGLRGIVAAPLATILPPVDADDSDEGPAQDEIGIGDLDCDGGVEPEPLPTLYGDQVLPPEVLEILDRARTLARDNVPGSPALMDAILAPLAQEAFARGAETVADGGAASISTPYTNTKLSDVEYPGDLAMDRKVQNWIRWNAAQMVQTANAHHPGIGGHIATGMSNSTLLQTRDRFIYGGISGGSDHPKVSNDVSYQG